MTLKERLAYALKDKAGTVLHQHGHDEFRLPQGGARRRRLEASVGEALCRGLRRQGVPQHFRRHKNHLSANSATSTARASSSNVTTSGNCTISRIASRRASSRARCSFNALLASSAGSGRSRKACSSCAAPPIACSAAATTNSRCLAPGAIRYRWSRWAPSWGAMFGSGLRTASSSAGDCSRPHAPLRCSRFRRILEELSLDIASPAEAREILQTKGADKVRFHV